MKICSKLFNFSDNTLLCKIFVSITGIVKKKIIRNWEEVNKKLNKNKEICFEYLKEIEQNIFTKNKDYLKTVFVLKYTVFELFFA